MVFVKFKLLTLSIKYFCNSVRDLQRYLEFLYREILIFFSEYEVCDNKYFTKELCAQYPSFQQCGCPLKAGGYALKDVNVDLPDIGVLKPIVAVST